MPGKRKNSGLVFLFAQRETQIFGERVRGPGMRGQDQNRTLALRTDQFRGNQRARRAA